MLYVKLCQSLSTWKTIMTNFLSVRVWTFFVSGTFFSTNTAMSGCKPSTCRSIVFLKFWICRTASDSIWVSMLTSACCFFSPLSTLNKSIEFYGYIEICWEILQYLWPDLGRSIMTPKLFPSNRWDVALS